MKKQKNESPKLDRRTVFKLGAAATVAGISGIGLAGCANSAVTSKGQAPEQSNPSSTLIKNAYIITMDEDLGDLDGADILLERGKIVEVGRNLQGQAEAVIDGTGAIVIPGFVDGHRHLWQTPMRGAGINWGFNGYIKEMLYRRAVCYEPEDMLNAGLAGGLECLNAGVTSVVDHCHNIRTPAHADAAVEGMLASGVGGVFGFCYGRTPEYGPGASVTSEQIRLMLLDAPQWRFEYAKQLKKKYFGDNSSPVILGAGTSFFDTFAVQRPKKAVEEMHQARELGVDLIMQHIRARGSFRVVEFMNKENLLGPDLMFSHADWVTTEELQMLAEHGTKIIVTPETELSGGNSPAYARATSTGIPVGLGMDTVIGTGGDMFGPMRWLMRFQRFEKNTPMAGCVQDKPSDIEDREVLHAATLGGAKAVNLDARVGSLTPGKQADVLMFRTDSLAMQPVNKPLATVVHYAHTGDIDSVWVAGKPVKRNGRIITHDTATVIRNLVASRDRILEKAATINIDGAVDLYLQGSKRES